MFKKIIDKLFKRKEKDPAQDKLLQQSIHIAKLCFDAYQAEQFLNHVDPNDIKQLDKIIKQYNKAQKALDEYLNKIKKEGL